jgi:hypothetical protein
LLRGPSRQVFNILKTSTFRNSMMHLSLSGSYMLENASESLSEQPGRSS